MTKESQKSQSDNSIASALENARPINADDTPPHEATAQSEKRQRGRPKGARNKVPRERQADSLMALVEDCEFWRDGDGESYVTFPSGEHHENWRIDSKQFKSFFTARAYERLGSVPGSEAIASALNVLRAKAYNGELHEPARRCANFDSKIYIDLCDDAWRVIEIDRHAWRLIETPPVKFLRSPSMRPLPIPQPDESGASGWGRLSEFLNTNSERDFALVKAWLVAAIRPNGPYPILLINGLQGTGKSTFTRLLRSLIDPSKSPIRSLPKDDRAVYVAAVNAHAICFDNVSHVESWLSDDLCRLATGGGFGTRALHTDTDEIVFDGARPIILNGIPHLAERPDLAERSITVTLRKIDGSERTTERDFWARWESAQPVVFSALLTAASGALRNLGRHRLDHLLRMADFCEWAVAAEQAIDLAEGEFLAAYRDSARETADDTFESNLVAVTLSKLIDRAPGDRFEGNATELLARLDELVSERAKKQRSWPQTASALGKALERIQPILDSRGIVATKSKSGERKWTITRVANLEARL